jgi:hypothetical protein
MDNGSSARAFLPHWLGIRPRAVKKIGLGDGTAACEKYLQSDIKRSDETAENSVRSFACTQTSQSEKTM